MDCDPSYKPPNHKPFEKLLYCHATRWSNFVMKKKSSKSDPNPNYNANANADADADTGANINSHINASSDSSSASESLDVKPGPKLSLSDILWVGLMPMIVGKTFIFYFGIKYSAYPEEGYGYGLVVAILFTLTTIGRFLWKYRNYSDD
jgi:hypothetical protein